MNENFEPQELNIDSSGWQKKTALFLSSQALSMFGSMLVQYAIIWHITLTTESGAMLTIATLSGFLPQLVISLFAGVWADRYSRKKLIIFADLLTAASTLVLAVLFLLGYQELWLLFVVSGIRALGAGIQAPAVGALLPQIVPTEKLMRVNSLNSMIHPFIMIAAPVLSGALLAYYRLEGIFFIDVVTAALAVGLLLYLQVAPYKRSTPIENKGYLDDLKAGLSYIRSNPAIRSLFIFFATAFFLVAPAAFLSPLLVARTYGEEVWRLTANEVTFFVGSLIGGFILAAWGGFKNRFQTIGLACLLWAVLFAGLGFSPNFTIYLVLMFLAGVPMPFLNVPSTTLLQELVPQEMQGRVFSVQMLIFTSVMPLGMLIFGPISDVISIEALMILSGIAMAVPGLWILFNRQLKEAVPALPQRELEIQAGD